MKNGSCDVQPEPAWKTGQIAHSGTVGQRQSKQLSVNSNPQLSEHFLLRFGYPWLGVSRKSATNTTSATEQASAKGRKCRPSGAGPHGRLSPEVSCTQPGTHPSSLTFRHSTSASAMFPQQGQAHSHTQLLRSTSFPPALRFHRVYSTQAKSHPLLLSSKSLV